MQVLVIDDSKAMRIILHQILESIGGQVAEAGNGRDGLCLFRSMAHVDAVLVDWNMPEMNGFDFVKTIRANPTYPNAPVMNVTTETGGTQMEKALEAGANEYVMEPFTKDVIWGKLQLLGIQ